MNPALLQRQAALAAGALLATLGVLVLGHRGGSPAPLPTPAVGIDWGRAVVGVLSAKESAGETRCGVGLGPETIGIAHPLLPCGVDLVVGNEEKEIQTEVIDQTPVLTDGPEFLLTRALARELGVKREGTIRWRFAG